MNNFNCKCIKCTKDFVSHDSADTDGEAFCPECIEENKVIAKKVDEQLAIRRANRQPANTRNIYAEARKKRKGTVSWMNI